MLICCWAVGLEGCGALACAWSGAGAAPFAEDGRDADWGCWAESRGGAWAVSGWGEARRVFTRTFKLCWDGACAALCGCWWSLLRWASSFMTAAMLMLWILKGSA